MKKIIFGLIISVVFLSGLLAYKMGILFQRKTPQQRILIGTYCWTPDGSESIFQNRDYWLKYEPDPIPGGTGDYDDPKRNDEGFIAVRNIETKEEKVLFKVPFEYTAPAIRSMDWSPVTNQILFSSFGEIYKISSDGSGFKTLVIGESYEKLGPYRRTPYIMRVGGKHLNFRTRSPIHMEGVTEVDFGFFIHTRWSPDGKEILTIASKPGERGIVIFDADGKKWRWVAFNADSCWWSPDGKQIVYHTIPVRLEEEGRYLRTKSDIYIINSDGTDKKMLVEYGHSPIWTPDGKWIIYKGADKYYAIKPDGTGKREVPIITPVTPPYPPRWQIIRYYKGHEWGNYDVSILEDEMAKKVD